jgi:hypothetical protein
MSILNADLTRNRKDVEEWVNGYTAGAVGVVVLTSPVPGTATAVLCGIEGTIAFQIGKIYRGDDWKMSDAFVTARSVGLAALTGKIAAIEAAILLGPFAPIGKAVIAAGIVKVMGQMIVRHFEVLAEGGR